MTKSKTNCKHTDKFLPSQARNCKENMKETVFEGDLTAESKSYPYTKITGKLIIPKGVTASFPALTSVGRYLSINANAKLDAPALTSVGGYLSINANAKLDAPALTSVGGYLYINANAKLDAPALTSVGGGLYIYANAKLDAPALTSVGGYLYINANAKLDALTSVGRYLSINANAKLDAPALTSVGGDLSINANAKLDAPALTSVGGGLYINANAKLDAPALTSIGGGFYAHQGAKVTLPATIKKNDPEAYARCRALLLSSFAAAGFSFADGVLARIVSQRGPVSRVVICGQTEVSYLVTDGEAFSHGKTLKEARDGLLFKIGKRDPSEFKAWTLDKVVPKRDAIRAYRIITGACEGGVRAWMEQRQTPEEITVGDIIKLTNGAYGAEAFKNFFERKAEAVHG
jgi:prefoldin subunit 5